MSDKLGSKCLVAVIGAGPAGIYASNYLAQRGVEVVLFNRDIKPGGLAEYGIFPDKTKLRNGLLNYFNRVLSLPNIHYLGNVKVGREGDISLDQLRQAGFQAIMVTTGAQTSNWLGLPGEDLQGVYNANEIVFHYNHLPEFAQKSYKIGRQVAVIGVGNVTMDIINFLSHDKTERVVTAYARRGPTEVKFDKETLAPIAHCLDCDQIETSVREALPVVETKGKDMTQFFQLLKNAREKAEDCGSGLTFRMEFLRSPRRMIGDSEGQVKEIVFELNDLFKEGDRLISRGKGQFETVPADTVIFSIGSQVDANFGLPVERGNFMTSPQPHFPIDGISYEVYNPSLCAECEDVFVSGWARRASEGIVGLAKKDAERGAQAVLRYLGSLEPCPETDATTALRSLPLDHGKVVTEAELDILKAAEQEKASQLGIPDYKFKSNEAMLKTIKGKLWAKKS